MPRLNAVRAPTPTRRSGMRLVCHVPRGDKVRVIFFDPSSTVGDAADNAAAALGLQGSGEGIWTLLADDGRRDLKSSAPLMAAGLQSGDHVIVRRIG